MSEKPIVHVCAYCKEKVKHTGSSAMWSRLSVRSYKEIMKGEYVQISHGICDGCQAITERKAIEWEKKQLEGGE